MFAAQSDSGVPISLRREPLRKEQGANAYAALAGRRSMGVSPRRAFVNSSIRSAENEVVKISRHSFNSRRQAKQDQAHAFEFRQGFLSVVTARLVTRLAHEMAYIKSRGWAALAGLFLCACIGVAVGCVSGVVLIDRFSAHNPVIAAVHQAKPQVAMPANQYENRPAPPVSKPAPPVAEPPMKLGHGVVCMPYGQAVYLRALEAANDALPKDAHAQSGR